MLRNRLKKREANKYRTKMDKDRSKIRSILSKDNIDCLKKLEGFYINELTNKIGTINVKLKTGSKLYPLEEAIRVNARKCFKYMMELDIFDLNKEDCNLLDYAIERDENYYIDTLLKFNLDVNSVNSEKVIKKLANRVKGNDLYYFETLLVNEKFDESAFNRYKFTMSKEAYDLVDDLEIEYNKDRVLITAMANNNNEIVNSMLKKGADINGKVKDVYYIGCEKLFYGYNNDYESEQEYDYFTTPLIYACFKNKHKFIKYLLEKGADPSKMGYVYYSDSCQYVKLSPFSAYLFGKYKKFANHNVDHDISILKLFKSKDVNLTTRIYFEYRTTSTMDFFTKMYNTEALAFLEKECGMQLNKDHLFNLLDMCTLCNLIRDKPEVRYRFIDYLIEKLGVQSFLMGMNSVYLINHIKNYGYSIVTELIQRCKFDLVKEFVNNGVKLKNHLPIRDTLTKETHTFIVKNLTPEEYDIYKENNVLF